MKPDPPARDDLVPEEIHRAFDDLLEAVSRLEVVDVEDLVERHPSHAEWLRARWESAQRGPIDSRGLRFYLGTKGYGAAPQGVEAGMELGDARLVRFIAEGGMGEVWEAEQVSVGRRIAVKVVRPDRVTDRAFERFAREARAGGRLNHPGIVTVHGSGETDGIAWIAMELVEGCWTLHDYLSEAEPDGVALTSEYYRETSVLLRKICEALGAAHDASVVHRDLKPQNILITRNDEPKVADFGLARLDEDHELTQTGSPLGTYWYMSPEQIRAGRDPLDHRTDIFSFGVIAYELFTRSRPFDGKTPNEISEGILSQEPRRMRSFCPEVPKALELIAEKCLEKDPNRRFASMDEIAEQLGRFLRGEPVDLVPVSGVVRTWRRVRRRPERIVGALAVIAVGAVAALAYSNAGQRESRIRAQVEGLYAQADKSLELNELDRVREQIDEAIRIEPRDPTAHLAMAIAYSKFARLPESWRELEAAKAKGFEVAALDDPAATAREHMASALELLREQDVASYPAAKAHLRRAIEIEPKLYLAHYSLYLVHADERDVEAARQDLVEYQSHLATGNPFHTVTSALLAELDGDHVRACETLERLEASPGFSEQDRIDLRLDRSLGRNYLMLGRLDEAEDRLERAVRVPEDCRSLGVLAEVSLMRFHQDLDPRWIDEMERRAESALACSATIRKALAIVAFARVERLALVPTARDPIRERADWKASREAIAALTDVFPEEPDARRIEARLASVEALWALDAGRWFTAQERWREAVRLDPDRVQDAVNLSLNLWVTALLLPRPARDRQAIGARDLEGGLAGFGRALEAYIDGLHFEGALVAEAGFDQFIRHGEELGLDSNLYGRLSNWGFAHAIARSDVPSSRVWRDRIEDALEDRSRLEQTMLCNYIESLSKAPQSEIRDCLRALELLDVVDPELFSDVELPEFERMANEILERCGE